MRIGAPLQQMLNRAFREVAFREAMSMGMAQAVESPGMEAGKDGHVGFYVMLICLMDVCGSCLGIERGVLRGDSED